MDYIPYNIVLCRYGELALKGKNRKRFENQLKDNMRHKLAGLDIKVYSDRGRMYIRSKDREPFTPEQVDGISVRLKKVFGLVSFSFGLHSEPTMEAIEATIREHFPSFLKKYEGQTDIPYRMKARRGDKRFPLISRDIEIHFAEVLLSEYPQLKLDLSNPELLVSLEVRTEHAIICLDRIQSYGGLPSGSSSRALVLLSGGIDSPVAAWQMMSRGTRLDFLTFHSYPYTPIELLPKVAELTRVLNKYQIPGKLYACNLAEAQKVIRDTCEEKYRTILYRRLMFRISERLALMKDLEALVTGESLGQVASQTMRNLHAINRSTDMLVLRPLLGMDKDFAVKIARDIETFEISNIECADSCTVFMPDSPITNSPLHFIEREEEKLDNDALIDMCFQTVSQVDLATGDETLITEIEEPEKKTK
ncbi:MAG: tRNA 4-thiouridine(8) synthase ThiI [Lentisphaeria bacterium]|nr:tRNA 4-thiouridine(8) synthase ThiI [Lentisphaeria bacterium]NQZ71276.1 tRNA 4-thiouridine(8) synthase ThiI [Lentisphaeria bacterium]